MIPAFLVLTLVLSVIFVWRAGHKFPSLAVLAAALAAAAGIFLLKNPVFAILGLGLALAAIYLPRHPRQ